MILRYSFVVCLFLGFLAIRLRCEHLRSSLASVFHTNFIRFSFPRSSASLEKEYYEKQHFRNVTISDFSAIRLEGISAKKPKKKKTPTDPTTTTLDGTLFLFGLPRERRNVPITLASFFVSSKKSEEFDPEKEVYLRPFPSFKDVFLNASSDAPKLGGPTEAFPLCSVMNIQHDPTTGKIWILDGPIRDSEYFGSTSSSSSSTSSSYLHHCSEMRLVVLTVEFAPIRRKRNVSGSGSELMVDDVSTKIVKSEVVVMWRKLGIFGNGSSLADLVLDTQNQVAYIADSAYPYAAADGETEREKRSEIHPAIVVYDAQANTIKRLLMGSETTLWNDSVVVWQKNHLGDNIRCPVPLRQGVSSLGLTCDSERLFFLPLASRRLHYVDTSILSMYGENLFENTEGLPPKVDPYVNMSVGNVGELPIVPGGMDISDGSTLYFADAEGQRIWYASLLKMNPDQKGLVPLNPLTTSAAGENFTLQFPAKMSFGKSELFFVTTSYCSYLNGEFNMSNMFRFGLWRADVNGESYASGCRFGGYRIGSGERVFLGVLLSFALVFSVNSILWENVVLWCKKCRERRKKEISEKIVEEETEKKSSWDDMLWDEDEDEGALWTDDDDDEEEEEKEPTPSVLKIDAEKIRLKVVTRVRRKSADGEGS